MRIQPELRKAGKLLRRRGRRVDGDAARRCVVLRLLPAGAEIASALEGQSVGLLVLSIHHPEASEAQAPQLLGV